MRRLLRLALPLGLLTALLAPTSAGAQTVSTDSGGTGGLTLLASSPTGLTTTSLTGDLHSNTTVDNLSIDARSVKVGSVITGTGIQAGTTVTSVGLLAGATVDALGTNNTLVWAARLPGAAGNGITVAYADPGGTTATLGASVVGQAVTINLGRGEVGQTGSGIIAATSSSSIVAAGTPATIAASPGGATEAGNLVTITTTAAHGFTTGQTVNLTGIGLDGYNGNFAIATTPTATTFTVLNATAGLAASGGGAAAVVTTPASPTNIIGASSAGSTATIATTTDHGLSVGQTVTVSGLANPLYNGTFVITAIPTLRQFQYAFAAVSNAAAPTGATEVGNTVTITTAAPHNFAPGQSVTIAGVGVAGYNGSFTIASVPTPTTYTVTNPTAALAASGGGTSTPRGVPTGGGGSADSKGASESGTTATVITTAAHNLQVGQLVTVSGVGVGGYNGDVYVTAVPTTSSFQYTAPAGLTDSGGGGVIGHSITGTGATEVGTTATITTRAAHGLQVGQQVTITGVPVGGYNGTFDVASVPTTTTFTYTTVAGLAASGGGSVYTVTTTAQNVIDAVQLGAGQFEQVNALVSAIGSGTVTGRLASNITNPPAVPVLATFTGGVDQALGLSLPATATSSGVALQTSYSRRNTDLAFWGNTVVQGDERGIRTFSTSDITTPLADFDCNGGYGDVSVYKNLVFRSIDRPQTTDQCAGSMDTFQGLTGGNHSTVRPDTTVAPGFEGIRIIDITNPAAPSFVKGVATDCGSFTNTLVPDLANNRVLLYVSSFPNVGLDTNATTASAYGNTCKRNAQTDRLGHSKITIVEVPLSAPATAHVLKTVTLPMTEVDPFFRDVQKIPGYTGDFSNVPGYRGCHDITVFLPKKEAAAACISDAFLLNISDPANPTVKSHFTNPYVDLCARGILRTTTSSPGPPNCMWNAAQFTNDGKYVMFSDLASGRANCTGNGTALGTATCNSDGNTQVGADRYYDGTATTNECEVGSGTGLVRSPWYRGAIWVYNVNDPSFPLTSFKEPRWERYTNQGCSSHLLNIIPKAGKYLTAASWQLAGVDVVNWTNLLFPTEEGYFDVNTTAAEGTANANPTNRIAGNSPLRANAWASYWYNGKLYVSYDSPQYGDWAPLGSRGLETFSLGGSAAAGALTLGHLNPQTQEELIKCKATVSGSFRVGVSAKHKVTLKFSGQGLRGITVQLKGYGIVKKGTTGSAGGVTFTVKPKKATKFTASAADAPNMLGCKVTKSVAKKRTASRTTTHKVAFRPTALSRRVI